MFKLHHRMLRSGVNVARGFAVKVPTVPIPVTVANGDGVGPEIMAATLDVLAAAKVPLAPEHITIGESVYLNGVTSGITSEGWESIARTNLLLKAPITTPLGKGVKSLNVTLRKTLGLFSNVRPVYAYAPFVPSVHPKIDMVIIRENEEDLYAGIEHRHTNEVLQCIKLITIPGCERIMRYAFEYCLTHGRKRLTCVTKSNIMKLTDGAFQQVFEDMAKQYPTIKTDHQIVDIATARVAAKPSSYDVIVTSNLYGDIISDVAAEVAGSVGLAG
jgi:isocitrate dehydrogenase